MPASKGIEEGERRGKEKNGWERERDGDDREAERMGGLPLSIGESGSSSEGGEGREKGKERS